MLSSMPFNAFQHDITNTDDNIKFDVFDLSHAMMYLLCILYLDTFIIVSVSRYTFSVVFCICI